MKEGYIVWNQAQYGGGYQIFGVYKSEKMAIRQLRKVIRNRYGKCPNGGYDAIADFLAKVEDGDDGHGIKYFCENEGEDWEPQNEED